MKYTWYYFYEFLREIYSRFLPGVLITAFNMAIIWTLRLAKRGKKFSSTPKLGREIQIQMPTAMTVVETKNLEDQSSAVVCIGLHQVSLNCCADVTSSPVLLERIELTPVNASIKESDSSDGISSGKIRPDNGSGLEMTLQEKIIRPCSVRPISPERSSKDSNAEHNTKMKKTRYIVVNDSRNEREVCLVFLLLAMTLLFYISSFPSALYKIIPLEDKVNVFRAIADVLEVSGHVFNFFLYFLLSPEFRKTLLLLIPRPRRFNVFLNAL